MHIHLAIAAALAAATPAAAATFTDAAGDILATYTGPAAGDLDLLAGSIVADANSVRLTATVNGTVGATPGSALIWGVSRGAGFPSLITGGPPAIGPASILTDAIVRLQTDGAGFVLLFQPAGPPVLTALAPGAVTIAGDTISANIPFALLPTRGFATDDYTYIAWSRSQLGSQTFIADLAPDDRTLTATLVPAPAGLLALGLGALGLATRRRRAI